YPRTSSQKIPPAINPKSILQKLKSKYKEVSLATREKPVEGAKSDPAHPSIYPTGERASLAGQDEKMYDLIARRFISCFCEDAVVKNKKIDFKVNNLMFNARGLEIVKKGWMQVYKIRLAEKEIRDLNGKYKVEKSRIDEKMTQPPKRYTPASLISELAKRNLGTKATRASIIETLYNRGYIKEKSIEATQLGISLIKTLEKESPVIIDEALTRKFEKEMDSIQTSKTNLEAREKKIIKEAEAVIEKISDEFKKKEKKIGEELIKANNNMREEERKNNELIICPKCGKGKLRIMYNKKSRRYFAACSAYPECKNTYTLPYGLIKPSGKICEKCNFPKLLRIQKGRRPWEFCFNPECESRKQES
ncbi:MAG: DNA topoisomerase, partial [Nanoarchaeota archaeon]